MQCTDIGIDLGTASILVYIKGKGVVLKEPSVVALDRETNKVITFGEEARLMIGRTPGNIVAVRPLRKGVISDYTVTEKMLKYFYPLLILRVCITMFQLDLLMVLGMVLEQKLVFLQIKLTLEDLLVWKV